MPSKRNKSNLVCSIISGEDVSGEQCLRRTSRCIPSSSSIRPQLFRRDPTRGFSAVMMVTVPGSMTVEGILHKNFASDPPAAEESSLLMDAAAPTPMEVATVSDTVGGGGGTDTRNNQEGLICKTERVKYYVVEEKCLDLNLELRISLPWHNQQHHDETKIRFGKEKFKYTACRFRLGNGKECSCDNVKCQVEGSISSSYSSSDISCSVVGYDFLDLNTCFGIL